MFLYLLALLFIFSVCLLVRNVYKREQIMLWEARTLPSRSFIHLMKYVAMGTHHMGADERTCTVFHVQKHFPEVLDAQQIRQTYDEVIPQYHKIDSYVEPLLELPEDTKLDMMRALIHIAMVDGNIVHAEQVRLEIIRKALKI